MSRLSCFWPPGARALFWRPGPGLCLFVIRILALSSNTQFVQKGAQHEKGVSYSGSYAAACRLGLDPCSGGRAIACTTLLAKTLPCEVIPKFAQKGVQHEKNDSYSGSYAAACRLGLDPCSGGRAIACTTLLAKTLPCEVIPNSGKKEQQDEKSTSYSGSYAAACRVGLDPRSDGRARILYHSVTLSRHNPVSC